MNRCPTPILSRFAPIVASAWLFSACSGDDADAATRADLTEVTRGPLVISVIESGEIKAAKSFLVKNEMEGNSTIIQLIDEGTIVKKGQLLVELDASSQIERRATQAIDVEKAIAAVINARKSLDILRKQVESDNRAAMNKWEFAKMDKLKFYGELLTDGGREMGEQEQSIKAEEAEIALAKSELKLAEDRKNWSEKLFKKDFITQDDLDRDRLDYDSKKTRVILAENRLEILRKYTHEKTRRELDQAELDAELEYKRTVAKGEAEITQADADLKAKIKEEELAKERLENLEKQIKSARVLAPTPGIVVYTSEGDRWRRRTVEIGTQVRERQSLIVLPDTSHMLAELKVQEAMIDRIRPGLEARIKIDASDAELQGKVLRRAPLPDSASRMSNPDLKEYKTTVDIAGNNADQLLRPNMSATVEIIVAELEDVLSLPQQAVFSQGAVQYVWLHTKQGPVATKIETGENNESRVVITKGLDAGQQVYLVEPEGLQAPEFEQPVAAPRPARDGDYRDAPTSAGVNGGTNGIDASPMAIRGERRAGPGPEGAGPGSTPGGRQNGGRRGLDPALMASMTKLSNEFKGKVKNKNPSLHQKIQEAGMRWSRTPEIKDAIEADPDLASEFAAYNAAIRKIFPRPSGEGRRRGGGEGQPRGANDGTDAGSGADGDRRRGGRRGGDGSRSDGEGTPQRQGADGN